MTTPLHRKTWVRQIGFTGYKNNTNYTIVIVMHFRERIREKVLDSSPRYQNNVYQIKFGTLHLFRCEGI